VDVHRRWGQGLSRSELGGGSWWWVWLRQVVAVQTHLAEIAVVRAILVQALPECTLIGLLVILGVCGC
jgi:hypothetical protein